MLEIRSQSAEETRAIGRTIARHATAGDIICLYGTLGSGKTVLAKGICGGLGVAAHEVISPTFVILREYQGRLPVYHFDLYRLTDAPEVFDIGYEEYLYGSGVSVVEWADRLGCLSPAEFLRVELSIAGPHCRVLSVSAHGAHYRELMRKIDEDTSR